MGSIFVGEMKKLAVGALYAVFSLLLIYFAMRQMSKSVVAASQQTTQDMLQRARQQSHP